MNEKASAGVKGGVLFSRGVCVFVHALVYFQGLFSVHYLRKLHIYV